MLHSGALLPVVLGYPDWRGLFHCRRGNAPPGAHIHKRVVKLKRASDLHVLNGGWLVGCYALVYGRAVGCSRRAVPGRLGNRQPVAGAAPAPVGELGSARPARGRPRRDRANGLSGSGGSTSPLAYFPCFQQGAAWDSAEHAL